MASPLAGAGAAIAVQKKISVAEKRALLLSNSGSAASKVADLGDALRLLQAYPDLPRELRNGANQLDKVQGKPPEDRMTAAAVTLEKAPDDALAIFILAMKVLPAGRLKEVEGALKGLPKA